MAWVKLDDGFDEDQKVEGLSDRAFRVYVSGLTYAARRLTDGAISAERARHLKATPKVVAELVDAGLWRPKGLGFVINDFLDYNPSRDEVQARRKENAERLRKWRAEQKKHHV